MLMVAPLAILGWTLLGGGAVAGASALSDSAGEAVEGAAEAAVDATDKAILIGSISYHRISVIITFIWTKISH